MARDVFELSGFKELERVLAEDLPKATSRGVLVRAATKSMEPMRRRMGELAPYDEGDRDGDGNHLRDTMRTQMVRGKIAKSVGGFDRKTGVAVITGPAPVGKRARDNAGWQEKGTVKMGANAYVAPAADAEAPTVIANIRGELALEVEKAVVRRAKRLGLI